MSMRRSLVWAFSGQLTAFVVQFAGMIVVARLLSPREMGIYSIAMAAIALIQVFTSFGIGSYVVREVELNEEILQSAFTVNAVLTGGLTVLLISLSFASSYALGTPDAAPVLRVIAIGNLLGIITFRPAAMLQREMRFKQLAIISVVQTIVQTLATIAFALAQASYLSPAYASLVAGVTTAALTLRFGRHHIAFGFSTRNWRPITVFGLQMMSVSGVATITSSLSDLLLGRILGVTALGLYGRASSVSSMVFSNLYGTATRVVFVQLSEDYRQGRDWRATFMRSFAVITAFMWPFLLGLAILSGPAVLLLYGERWLPAAAPLAALMVAQFVGVAFGMNWELFAIRQETGRQSKFEITRMIFGVPLFAAGCAFGIVAAAAAKIVDSVIGLILYYPQVRRLADLDPREVPAVYRTSGGLTLAAVLPSVGVMIWYDWSARAPLPAVFSGVFIGIALWFGMIVATRHPLRAELFMLLDKLRRQR